MKGFENKTIASEAGRKSKRGKGKDTSELRQRVNDFLSENWNLVKSDWLELEPKERLRFYEKLLSYGLPQLQRMEYVNDLDITQMTDQEIEFLINKLTGNETRI